MIKQDIIKAREELAAKEALDKGYIFERTYKLSAKLCTLWLIGGKRKCVKTVSALQFLSTQFAG